MEFDDGTGPVLVAGGSFQTAGGAQVNRVAKWDGQFWSALGGGLNGLVRSLCVHDDGTGPALIAGGSFTQADGAPALGLARWTGRQWTRMGAGVTANGQPASVHVLLSGVDANGPCLYIGGDFTAVDGVQATRIAKFSAQSWSALGIGCDDLVSALTMHNDGSGLALFAGGRFLTAGGLPAWRVAKWSGTAWSGLFLGVSGGFEPQVRALATFDGPNGHELLVSGQFKLAGGLATNSIASWNGSAWSNWLAPAGTITITLAALAVKDGIIYAAGSQPGQVTMFNGAWTVLGPGIVSFSGPRALRWVRIGKGGDPVLYTGGSLTGSDGISMPRISRFVDGAWLPLSNAVNGHIRGLVVDDGGSVEAPSLFALGRFTAIGGLSFRRIAQWNGTVWSSVGGGVGGGSDISVTSMLTRRIGGVTERIFAGRFTTAGTATVNGIARWDGSTWTGFGTGLNLVSVSTEIRDISFFRSDGPTDEDDDLIAAGSFASIGGSQKSNIAKWNGTTWLALADGLNGAVNALVVHDDGVGAGPLLIAGGAFTASGSTSLARIARWDGVGWTPLGGGLNGTVFAMLSLETKEGPRLLVAGAFTSAGSSVPAKRVAVWNGLEWSTLGSGFDDGAFVEVHALFPMEVEGQRVILAGGNFASVGGKPAANCAMWNGSEWQPIEPGVGDEASPFVAAVAEFHAPAEREHAIWFGGGFLSSDQGDSRLARWRPCFDQGALLGDINADGTVDGADLAILLGSWGTANGAADLNGDGVVDGADLAVLLGSWSST